MSLKSEFGQGVGKISTIENLIGDNDFIDNLAKKIAKDNGATGIYTKKGVDGNLAKKANTADVYTKNDANTTFLKTADLGTKVAEKAVVDVLVPALATVGTDDTKKVYTKTEAGSTFLKTAELKTKAAAKDVVNAITASSDFTNKVYIKAAPADEVYTKTAAENTFLKAVDLETKVAEKAVLEAILKVTKNDSSGKPVKVVETELGTTFAKKDGTNIDKDFAGKVFNAKDGDKSILVDKLEGFLAENAKAYSNNTKTAKELLVPSAADLVQDHDFKHGIDKSIKEMAVSSNSDFQKNVREVMSQPSFEIPTSDDAASVP